jgi:hypothetical protein
MLFDSYTMNHHKKCSAFVQSDISKHIQIVANVGLLKINIPLMLDIIPNMNNMASTPICIRGLTR